MSPGGLRSSSRPPGAKIGRRSPPAGREVFVARVMRDVGKESPMKGSKPGARAGWVTVLAVLALALAAGPACRSGAPGAKAGAPVAPPDLLRSFVGQTLILRHRGDDKTVSLKRGQLASLSGECDVVVEVRSADFERGTARLNLQIVGRPRLARRGARQERCRSDPPPTLLAVSGFAAGASAQPPPP